MNILLDEAKRDMDVAARKAERLRGEYNEAVADWKKAKLRWEKLSEAQLFAEADLAEMRRRALAAGNTELASLLVPEPR